MCSADRIHWPGALDSCDTSSHNTLAIFGSGVNKTVCMKLKQKKRIEKLIWVILTIIIVFTMVVWTASIGF